MRSFSLVLALLFAPTLAFAQAGRFLLAVGDVVVVRGASEIRAGTGAEVNSGDTIRVGQNSNAQIRMTDASILALRPGTVLRIDEFRYSDQSSGDESAIFSLLKGGFRTITGSIGKLHRERYAVRTPTATVGIRGTHYIVVHCDDDCGPAKRVSLAALDVAQADTAPGLGGAAANGTYGGVTDGRIGVTNNAGESEFGSNEYFHVADANTRPQSIIAPPPFLYDRLEGQLRSRGRPGNESSETMVRSGINGESRPSEVPAPPQPSPFVVTEEKRSTGSPAVLPPQALPVPGMNATVPPAVPPSAIPLQAASAYALAYSSSSSNSSDGVTSLAIPPPTFNGAVQLVSYTDIASRPASGAASLGTARVASDFGSDGIIAWGRWTGGVTAGGVFPHPDSFTVGNQSFHYIVGLPTSATDMATLQRGGLTGTYSLLGATTPTFLDGVGGGLGVGTTTGNLSVNFATSSVAVNLVLSFAAATFTATSAAVGNFTTSPAFSGTNPASPNTTSTNTSFCPIGCYTTVSGFFAGPSAVRAGLGYTVNSPPASVGQPGVVISGAATFKKN